MGKKLKNRKQNNTTKKKSSRWLLEFRGMSTMTWGKLKVLLVSANGRTRHLVSDADVSLRSLKSAIRLLYNKSRKVHSHFTLARLRVSELELRKEQSWPDF